MGRTDTIFQLFAGLISPIVWNRISVSVVYLANGVVYRYIGYADCVIIHDENIFLEANVNQRWDEGKA